MINWTPPQGTKVTYPTKSLKDPGFTYRRGSDVQARWREHGWTPPFENEKNYAELSSATSKAA